MSLLLLFGQGDQTVIAAQIELSLGLPAPSRIDQNVSPAAIALSLDLPAPSVMAGLQVSPAAIALTLGAPAVTRIDQEVRDDIAPLLLSVQIKTPTGITRGNVNVSPAAVPVAVTAVAPSRIDQTASVAAITLSASLVAPSRIDEELLPAAMGLTLGAPSPVIVVPVIVSPAGIALVLGLPSPAFIVGAPPAGPSSPVAEYVVEIFDSGATFGPGSKLGELWDARNLGWSAYDRIPGKAFLTLSQRSSLLSLMVPLTTHVRIWRLTPTLTTLVYQGELIDYDSSGDDVVFSAFDYVALLSISRSGYRTMYPTKKVGTEIVNPEWVLAKGATSSPLGFVVTGTIEDPLGTDEATAIKTNAQFGLLDQMRLQLFFDLSEIGRANTIHQTTFEITRTTTPTFNFWKNKGSNIDLGLVLNGNVSDYRYLPNWTSYRNDLATLGTTVGGGATEVIAKDDTAAAAKARRQDVFTIKTLLGIVGAATEADQQKAAADRMLKSALQLQPVLQLRMIRGGIDFFNGWDINDKPIVEIGNGIDSISTRWRIVGARATFDETGESPSLLVQPVAA